MALKSAKVFHGFESFDLSGLVTLADKGTTDRGFAYFRNYHVEALRVETESGLVHAQVAGSGSSTYETSLQLIGGVLEHSCECRAWRETAPCKHVVASLAALLLVIGRECPWGALVPSDYIGELRVGLGLQDAPGEGDREVQTVIWLTQITTRGAIRFLVEGESPDDLLEATALNRSDEKQETVSVREFLMENPERDLPVFLKEATERAIPVRTEIDGRARSVSMSTRIYREQWTYDWNHKRIERRRRFLGPDDVEDPFAQAIPASPFILLGDGQVARCEGFAFCPRSGLFEEDSAVLANESMAAVRFNAEGARIFSKSALPENSHASFKLNGQPCPLNILPPSSVRPQLNLDGLVNAAGELEGLDFLISLRQGAAEADLSTLTEDFFKVILGAETPFLSAKSRIASLFDAIKALLSERMALSERGSDAATETEAIPTVAGKLHSKVANRILGQIDSLLGDFKTGAYCLALDFKQPAWKALPFDLTKILYLLASLSALTSRDALKNAVEGILLVPRGQPEARSLRRIMDVCQELGVAVIFNQQLVLSAKVDIRFEGVQKSANPDWFDLHPSIRCGERELTDLEWRQLIGGDLLVQGKEGHWLLPDFDQNDEEGARLLTRWLDRQANKKTRKNSATPLIVNRLEMLDWIALRQRGVRVELPPEAESVFTSLQNFEQIAPFSPPAGLHAELRDYQKEGCAWIDFLFQHRFGACLADDMGLGKTIQAIAFILGQLNRRTQPQPGTVLIVVPPSLVFNWLDELRRFAPGLIATECLSASALHTALQKADILITTYDRLRIDTSHFRAQIFDILVFDEAHMLKNVAAGRTRSAAALRRRFTLCLTGTPVENNASEFFSVLSAAVPGIFGSLKEFKDVFAQDPDRILARARPFILRRKKEKILKELPPKEEHSLFLEMTPLQKEIYARTVTEVRAEVAEAYKDRPGQQAGIVALAAILRLRQVCVSPSIVGKTMTEPAPKFVYLKEKMAELGREGHAALVFSQFLGGLNELEKVARESGIDYLRMDGQTPIQRRKEIVASFQSPNGPSFFFISLKTGGVGLNLTRANYVFHLDPWWNPSVENQASDRAHRIGQTRSVFVQRLIMRHTIEERMLELKARKAELFRLLVDAPGGKTAGSGLSRKDFEFLIA